ncbi:MAG TPA: hypothetical protein VGE08_07210 [Steroidobacter sp.]
MNARSTGMLAVIAPMLLQTTDAAPTVGSTTVLGTVAGARINP